MYPFTLRRVQFNETTENIFFYFTACKNHFSVLEQEIGNNFKVKWITAIIRPFWKHQLQREIAINAVNRFVFAWSFCVKLIRINVEAFDHCNCSIKRLQCVEWLLKTTWVTFDNLIRVGFLSNLKESTVKISHLISCLSITQ